MEKLFYVALAVCAFSACTSPNNSQTSSEELKDSLEDQMVSRPLETQNPDPAHNSQNAIDWMGTYEATLPCADCPGIKTVLVLREDETFEMRSEYLERDVKFEDKGTFEWKNNGSVVHLKGEDTDIKLKVGEHMLFQLDQDGNEITGDLAEHYIYKKQM
ncbi:copper resistance protein NlpE [Sphingobacterium gobiense]|uniref:Copper resistance protein NlpE n=1 Tax=Sphingobacterium gobiense TaxID=1382456 RepID=A0A2S9JLR3_9SPHI|nr:copper resistance protein NlpE [Sphingobacterium gobiense]PRD54056.1 copper resistance protein NlpE [Sphingobacterium gobiense]